MMLFAFMFKLSILGQAFAGLQNVASYDGTTLKYYNQNQDSATFAGAVVECIKKGSELVMPKYSGLNTAVAKVAQNQQAWIGGGDFRAEGLYEWNDGKSLEWTNWAPDEPNDYNDGNDGRKENCMEINYYAMYKWNDNDCCSRRGYVCQIPGSRSQPYEYSSFTVYSSTHAMSYADAKQFCEQRSARLVYIESKELLTHLKKALNESALSKYWVDYKTSWDNACSMVSWNSIHNTNCELSLPFVCEAVDPHDLTVSDETPEAVEGSDLKIDCFASGFPRPSVAWYRDDVFLSNQELGEASSTLTLENVSQSDAGLYVCRALNEIGGRSRQMEGYSILEVLRLD